MPINEHGVEVINGFIVLGANWNSAGTVRDIIAVRNAGIDSNGKLQFEYVVATAGPEGVREWFSGHYFWNDLESAHAYYLSR